MHRKRSGNNRRMGWIISLESGRGYTSTYIHAETAEYEGQSKIATPGVPCTAIGGMIFLNDALKGRVLFLICSDRFY